MEQKKTSPLKQLCSLIPRVEKAHLKELFCQIHNEAALYPCPDDHDIGADALEEMGDAVADRKLKREIYEHALFRAKWFVSGATAGGEALARGTHVMALQRKFEDA